MNPSDKFFCALESRSNKEFIYGTAPRVASWLLVEYPGVWRSEAIRESDLSCEARDRLTNLGRSCRCLFIRQSHDGKIPLSCFAVDSKEIAPAMRRHSFSSYDEVSLAGSSEGETVAGPVFLVCTHGNHDKCCSKFGLPVYELLRQVAGDRVWQCSHVGGDRFAANIICFPHGVYYGHVNLADVSRIVEAHTRGKIHLQNYRGRCCYTRCDQVAEYFVRAQSGILGLEDLRLTSSSGMTAQFASAGGFHQVEFREKSGLSQVLTCKSEGSKPVPQYELVRYEFRPYI
jgi:hypothetical protein